MTNEQIRIKVATACGWKHVGPKGFGSSDLVGASHKEPSWPLAPLPDYPADLNACAEFEKTLTTAQRSTFAKHLLMVVSGFPFVSPEMASLHYEELFGVAHATALQRCEAFLRCLGLWEEPAPGAKEEGV